MQINTTQKGEIYSACRNAGIFVLPLKVVVIKDNLVHTEYLFENIEYFIKALKKLDGFIFENAMNGTIGARKDNEYYSFQVAPVDEVFNTSFNIQ